MAAIQNKKMPLYPRVGLGVLVFNEKNEILLGKRQNAHGASSWGPPGGHLEFAETFEEGAIREVKEEAGMAISSPSFLSVTNDVFDLEKKHYISVFMTANILQGQVVKNLEPHKVEDWFWIDLEKLPKNVFLPLKHLVLGENYDGQHNPHLALIRRAQFITDDV